MMIPTAQILEDYLYYYVALGTTEKLGNYSYIPPMTDEQVEKMFQENEFPEWYHKCEWFQNPVNKFISNWKAKYGQD